MLRLTPLKSEKVWGYELWIASTHQNGLQKEFQAFVGGDYPLLTKIIQANDVLSVQVHPDDEKAMLYENCRGKTECWYVLDAEKDASLVYGFNGVYTESEIRKAVQANSPQDLLRFVKVEKGDFIYIPAGTVHAIGKGLRLLEVQQSCDVTYRLYDWGRGRECHIEKAISVIKSNDIRSVTKFLGVFSCPYFTLEKIIVEDTYSSSVNNHNGSTIPEDYILLFVSEGEGKINGENVKAEDIFAFAPGEEIKVEGNLIIIKITPAG